MAYIIHMHALKRADALSDAWFVDSVCLMLLQIKDRFGAITPPFPPRRLMSLTPEQVEERRQALDTYMREVCSKLLQQRVCVPVPVCLFACVFSLASSTAFLCSSDS